MNQGGGPSRFVWRGRPYTVRAVLGHWVVNREWWRDPDAVFPRPVVPGRPALPEMDFWRVEAAAGRGGPPGTYDLCRDVAADVWTLRGIAD